MIDLVVMVMMIMEMMMMMFITGSNYIIIDDVPSASNNCKSLVTQYLD